MVNSGVAGNEGIFLCGGGFLSRVFVENLNSVTVPSTVRAG